MTRKTDENGKTFKINILTYHNCKPLSKLYVQTRTDSKMAEVFLKKFWRFFFSSFVLQIVVFSYTNRFLASRCVESFVFQSLSVKPKNLQFYLGQPAENAGKIFWLASGWLSRKHNSSKNSSLERPPEIKTITKKTCRGLNLWEIEVQI